MSEQMNKPTTGTKAVIRVRNGATYVAKFDDGERGLVRGWWDGLWRHDESDVEWWVSLDHIEKLVKNDVVLA